MSGRRRQCRGAGVWALAACCIYLMSQAALAATATATIPVSMTITAGCQVTTGSVAFGSSAGLFSTVVASVNLNVTCSNSTAYTIGLDAGSGSGATTTTRKMTGPSATTINYGLYRDAGLTAYFGNTAGTDTVAGVGNGSAQNVTIYGQVPAQSGIIAGSYSDIVNVTLTY